MYQNKIVIIACYYGRFPWFFQYFIDSCKYNPTIDFLIFSDCSYEKALPSNVIISMQSLQEFRALASEKLGFEVNIKYPYKICDYKPVYGFIFSDFIEGYDFWGQCDIDVIFGDIRAFLTDDLLNGFDFINPRHDYTTGCFMLFRNTAVMNNLFRKSKDYKRVFLDSLNYCFDECNFAQAELREGISIFEANTEIESFTHVVKRAGIDGYIKAHFDFIIMEGVPGRLKFDKGKIVYRNRYEALLYHLFRLKKVYSPKKIPVNIPEIYYISDSGIYFKKR